MKALLLHPEDCIPQDGKGGWDRIIDFGRAPQSTYRGCACDASSVFELSSGIDDLRYLKNLLQSGLGTLVDSYGLDWWDILSVSLASNFEQALLVRRLVTGFDSRWELHATRPDRLFSALAFELDSKLAIERRRIGLPRVRRYAAAVTALDSRQLAQVIQDKFDPQHSIRRRFAKPRQKSSTPVILLPSAYVNVSRTAVSYAARLPDERFLLVWARATSKLSSVPANVRMAPLDGYFGQTGTKEIAALEARWAVVKQTLMAAHEEFRFADAAGIFDRMPALLRWGVAVRNAWLNVFDREEIAGCLCADDSNPYSRIPLILARQKRITTLACHHGALDYRMVFKTQYADRYLTKSEMERDYLQRVCKVERQRIALAGSGMPGRQVEVTDKKCAVFFTEPYDSWGWRTEEVYRNLLPHLLSAAERCGLKLVFKLHPFESLRGYRRMIKRLLSPGALASIEIVHGPCESELWQSMKFAITVQSTAALECVDRGIPVFLCGWLSDPYSGYVEQFARFGFGRVLHSASELQAIPELLKESRSTAATPVWDSVDKQTLRELLVGARRNSEIALCAGAFAS